MGKCLIAYFSASGVTKGVAEKFASAVNGDLFEIEPKAKYSSEDLDWTNRGSRSSVEMRDSIKPEIAKKVDNLQDYDKVAIGFPVWWYTAPTIINKFIEENDLKGKQIYVFVTSGSSGCESSFNNLKNAYKDLTFVSGKRFCGDESASDFIEFLR